MAQSGSLRSWIEALPEHGRYVFTRAEAGAVADGTDSAIKMALYRLKRAGAIVSPRRDFYVVVPREYRSAGAPPATWFIDDLMRHLGRRYYVALLSAAALHGAGHQRPMAFQIITDAAERDIEVGRVRIDFHVSRRLAGDGCDGGSDARDDGLRPRAVSPGLRLLEKRRDRHRRTRGRAPTGGARGRCCSRSADRRATPGLAPGLRRATSTR